MLVDKFRKLSLPFNQFVHLVIAHRFGELHIHLFVFFQDVNHLLHALLYYILNGQRFIEFRFLRQVADTVARRENHLALIGFVDTGDDFQQGGLAGAVQTEHADFRTIVK